MRVIVVSEARFGIDLAGKYIAWGTIDKRLLMRYKDVFSEVMAVGRIKTGTINGQNVVEGDGISVVPLPDYYDVQSFLKYIPLICLTLYRKVAKNDVVIIRIPGPIGFIAFFIGAIQRKVVAAEVVGDPWDAFRKKAVKTPARIVLRLGMAFLQKMVCTFGHGAAYVTAKALQKRYPPRRLTSHYSSIDLGDEWIVDKSELNIINRAKKKPCEKWILTFVGSLAQLYKGPDVLLRAIYLCRLRGWNLKCKIVGDGRMRYYLEKLSQKLEIDDSVVFLGRVDRSEVCKILDTSDLFVLPSRQEGLPRSIIEAMSRGLPVISTNIGGIPELLHAEALVPIDDPEALCDKISYFITNTDIIKRMVRANVTKAKEYRRLSLQAKRIQFYKALHDLAINKKKSKILSKKRMIIINK